MTVKKGSKKPAKPRPDFPLTVNPNGQWSKKVRGKTVYFGPWADPDAAEKLWDIQKDDLRAGRVPRVHCIDTDGPVLKDAINQFLASKKLQVTAGELSERQFNDLVRACEHIAGPAKTSKTQRAIGAFGRDRLMSDVLPADFCDLKSKMVERYKTPTSLRREMTNVRSIFKYAYRNGIIDREMRFGSDFDPPSTKAIRKYANAKQAEHGDSAFTAPQIRAMLDDLDDRGYKAFRCMVLLGINCGLGNNDVKYLTLNHFNLNGNPSSNLLDYPRPKTGAPRRSMMWEETADAIRDYLETRKEPIDEADARFVFHTRERRAFHNKRGSSGCTVVASFGRLAKRVEVDGVPIQRPGLSFYSLRRSARTIADGTRDQPACNLMMGHVDSSMGAVYRQFLPDEEERLQAIADRIHSWLFDS